MSTDIKLRKAQIKKVIMSGGGLAATLGRLIAPLAKNILMPLGLSAAMSGIDGAIQKKIHGYGTTVIFSSEEMNDMIKIVKSLEDSDILMKGSTETLQNDVKKGGALLILPMLLGTLGVSLLSGRGLYRAGSGNKCNCKTNHQGNGLYRACEKAGQGIKKKH